MAVEYTINVNAITSPPIIGVEVAQGCGGGSTKEEVLVQPTEPTVDWIDGLWCDTSTLVTSMDVDEVVVTSGEPVAYEIWGDTSTVTPITVSQDEAFIVLMRKVELLEQRIRELEGGE